MYADDLILLSISLRDMQYMIDIRQIEFNNICMAINSKKTACLRIGNRHNVFAKEITVQGKSIDWKQELKYLGIVITFVKRFKTNM